MSLKSILVLCLSLLTATGLRAAELQPLSAQQLQAMQQNQALVIDVRTEAEWQATGIIPGSQKLQAFDRDGHFDAVQWLAKLQKMKSSPDQAVILVCRSGRRSGKVGEFLIQQGLSNVYHLDNGIQAWQATGHSLQSE